MMMVIILLHHHLLPTYNAQPIEATARKVTFSGTFSGTEFKITPGVEHGYYTGESVYYAANITVKRVIKDDGSVGTKLVRDTALFADGLYFVERVDGFTLKFAKSREDIYNDKYVSMILQLPLLTVLFNHMNLFQKH